MSGRSSKQNPEILLKSVEAETRTLSLREDTRRNETIADPFKNVASCFCCEMASNSPNPIDSDFICLAKFYCIWVSFGMEHWWAVLKKATTGRQIISESSSDC